MKKFREIAGRLLFLCDRGRVLTQFHRGRPFFEAGVSLLFFGVFAHHGLLQAAAHRAVAELQQMGYAFGGEIRVYPLETSTKVPPGHAGTWSPGVLAIRANAVNGQQAELFLRHELMHEAMYRTCGVSGQPAVAPWAYEAAAIAFSGESAPEATGSAVIEPEGSRTNGQGSIDALRESVRLGAPLTGPGYRALRDLVTTHGWPRDPCRASVAIDAAVAPRGSSEDPLVRAPFSYVLVSVMSGRVLESQGSLHQRYPPGSVLKIPYVAQLNEVSGSEVGEELARSDTEALMSRHQESNRERFQLIYSNGILGESPLYPGADESAWRSLLGERDADGRFSYRYSLVELAKLFRFAYVSAPERFSGLRENGSLPASTLESASPEVKRLLRELCIGAKTGTISDSLGHPLMGHVAMLFPMNDPLYVAIARKGGLRGAQVMEEARTLLKRWHEGKLLERGAVRVSLLEQASPEQVQIRSPCPHLERSQHEVTLYDSACGEFIIETSLRGALPERRIAGRLEKIRHSLVLVTDPESYADGVLEAEADSLTGEARKALRALIAWNGIHGGHRHQDTHALCDTTHCQVFRGVRRISGERVSSDLLDLLDSKAARLSETWLPFSLGGLEPWQKVLSLSQAAERLREPVIFHAERERLRSGEVQFRFMYQDSEETLSCEALRKAFSLPSCPESIQLSGETLRMSGVGRGHGQGLNVSEVERLGQEGGSALSILRENLN